MKTFTKIFILSLISISILLWTSCRNVQKDSIPQSGISYDDLKKAFELSECDKVIKEDRTDIQQQDYTDKLDQKFYNKWNGTSVLWTVRVIDISPRLNHPNEYTVNASINDNLNIPGLPEAGFQINVSWDGKNPTPDLKKGKIYKITGKFEFMMTSTFLAELSQIKVLD